MGKKNTISYTVGANLDGNVEVTHELYGTKVETRHSKASLSKSAVHSKQKTTKKGAHYKRFKQKNSE